MKQSLQLGINQHVTLTPQLQQAIRLLQLSTVDLQQEIQLIVESNPMLEATPNEDKEDLQHELPLKNYDEPADFQWSELYQISNKQQFNEGKYNFDNLYCTTTNLKDHLRWQLELEPMSDVDKAIATAIIDAMNNDGLLSIPITEIHTSLTSEKHPITLEEIETVRHRLQLFDPVGCASLNLIETLLVQLEQLPLESRLLALTKRIIHEDLDLLGQHNYKQLTKNHRINEQTVHEILRIIQSLNPKPGNLIHHSITEYIIPDLTVKKVNQKWLVFLNQNVLPNLSINNQYAALIQHTNNNADNQFLKNNLQEARWFLKSIKSRQETLLKVATCIMEYQQGFLELGEEAMKPLILHDIASALDMHESTISRITTQKFIYTPRGVFELKYFFSSHINTNTGTECSSTAIRAMIKKLIAAEHSKKPLSDSKITLLLKKQGIQVARRTIAKYREAMGIAPSHERKKFVT